VVDLEAQGSRRGTGEATVARPAPAGVPGFRTVTSPRLVRAKTSAAVVEYVLDELFAGRIKSGDRIDLDEIGTTLGVSRLPVREALLILERDGVVSTRYHRGVYVEPFDAESITDDFEIMGLLSGVAVRRLAETRDPEIIGTLQGLVDELRAADPQDQEQAYQLVRTIISIEHRAGGSRRLRAAMRSHAGSMPSAFRMITDRSTADTLKAHERVLRAVRAGDGEKAARYRLEDFRDAGRRVVRSLEKSGVISRPAG
jgi:DNA-binding GntR family transcriptional regulator